MSILKEASRQTGLSIESLEKIEEMIKSQGNFCLDRIKSGLYTFCCKLGMNRFYFKTTPLDTIAKHIESIMSAEIIAINQGSKELEADFVSERENSSMYLVDDDHEKGMEIERRLEDKFPNYRLQSYRTPGVALESHFRSYFVTRPDFPVPDASPSEADIEKVAAKEFIQNTTNEARERFQRVLHESIGMIQPDEKIKDYFGKEEILFLTQPARLALEEKGVIIFKDASANKGGVTSSSLEVLAALVLTDEEYDRHMCVKDGQVPEFRKNYVADVMSIIRDNARLEFEVLWQENKSTGTPLSILIASHFIYNCRLQGDEIDFHRFLEQLKSGAS
jgi:hypothetical protein